MTSSTEGLRDVHVTAAVLWRDGRLLACLRPVGKRMGGLWELPGGKVETGETREECLRRELEEELGVQVRVGAAYMSVTRDEPPIRLCLHAFVCELGQGQPTALEHDELRWLAPDELSSVRWAPADRPIVARLETETAR